MQLRKIMTLLSLVLLMATISLASPASFNKQSTAKPADNISGKYEGVAKSDQMGDIPLTVELKNDNGKLSGKIETPQGPAAITSGTYADGKLTMKFDAGGNEGTVTATVAGDKISGKWELGGQGGPLELKKSTAVASGDAKKDETKPATPATGDMVTGDWDASADAQGTSIPFTLKLKLDGDKVTGSSESAQGSVPISKGSFVANKLSVSLETPQGAIVLTGMVKDGKIVGEFDFAGQMTGKWEAKKK